MRLRSGLSASQSCQVLPKQIGITISVWSCLCGCIAVALRFPWTGSKGPRKTTLFKVKPKNTILHLQLIQNTDTWLFTNSNKQDHITPASSTFYWLPHSFGTDFKIFLITFKALKGSSGISGCFLVLVQDLQGPMYSYRCDSKSWIVSSPKVNPKKS